MLDYFALLNQPRRPWLDADALKTVFHARSAEVHPDRVHQAAADVQQNAQQVYTELNAGYQCLREPRTRLRHLLELESGAKPSDLTDVPDDLMELFFQVGAALRKGDAFRAEKAAASSPLLQVQFFEQSQGWIETLGALQREIAKRREELLTELRVLDAEWSATHPEPTEALLRIWRLLSFYDRWVAQLQERVAQLSF